MNHKAWLAIGILLLVMVSLPVIWFFQGSSMRGDFVRALRSGDVGSLHRDLQGKTWSDEELESVEVVKVPAGTGPQRATARHIHDRGRVVISSLQYEYQGTVKDNATGIVHVFGYRRREPRRWNWETIHPASRKLHVERRMKQLEQMKEMEQMKRDRPE